MSESWVAVREVMPWLPLPPYLVVSRDLPRLRSDLGASGFKVFEASAEQCRDERSLLTALGDALSFPDYYGANWAAFDDCIGDMLREHAGRTAVVVVGADALLKADVHAFARSVHLLSEVVTDVEQAASDGFQFEVFFVGDFSLKATDSRDLTGRHGGLR